MEEGSGLGMYILIGAILFSLFTATVTTFGGGIQGFLGELTDTVVNGEVFNGDEVEDEVEDEVPDESSYQVTHIGPTGYDWLLLTKEERVMYQNEFLEILKGLGAEGEPYYEYQQKYTPWELSGYLYAHKDDDGNILGVYGLGNDEETVMVNNDIFPWGGGIVQVNDERLVPDELKNSPNLDGGGKKNLGNGRYSYYVRPGNEFGASVEYNVIE